MGIYSKNCLVPESEVSDQYKKNKDIATVDDNCICATLSKAIIEGDGIVSSLDISGLSGRLQPDFFKNNPLFDDTTKSFLLCDLVKILVRKDLNICDVAVFEAEDGTTKVLFQNGTIVTLLAGDNLIGGMVKRVTGINGGRLFVIHDNGVRE